MAAEVSVSDVLCEAMDYLSKLGSNLKTRTDNLKEKRIRKDKLRNSRSVHKAANKVLLICELSKKSLENVEKGVRKILDKVIMTQTASSDGGNLGVNCNSETDMKFQQFYYGSRALRICKTVPVKHYMSAKVRVRNMSVSMQEKYPVYYDCKLYRIRRKKLKPKEQLQIGMENEKPEMPNAIQNKNSSTYEACCSNKVDFLSSHDDPSKDNTVEQEQVVDINTRPLVETFSSTQSVNASETSILVLIQENKDAENMLEVQTVQRLDKHMLEDNQTPLTNRESETCENLKNNCENIKNNTADESVSSDKELIKGTAKVRSKKHRVLDDSSDDNENVQNNDSKTKTSDEVSAGDEEVVSENNKIQINKTLNAIAPDNDEDSKTKQSLLDINEQPAIETNEISDDTKKSEELTTPHIKCVNIFKLLKPDIVNNIQSESEKKISIKHSRPKTYKSIKPYLRKPQTCSINELKENELVIAKRKEVLAFKPKKFIIKLHRLPSFSKALLHKYKLKRIMQNGSVLCEVDLVDTNMIKESDVEKYNLLNDSDTDDIAIKRLSTERKRVKYALLHDSDSDDVEINNINDNRFARSVDQENVDTEFQATSSKVLDVDISESHSCKPKKGMTETNRRETLDENGLTENIKRSLLDESDVDMPDIEENNLMTEQMLKSSNENFGNISDMLNATENSLELCNETYSTAQNIDKIKHTEASNLELIIDNNVLTLLANKEHEGINPIDLDKHKPDNNSCESLDNNDFLTKEKNSVDKSVKGTSIEVSNSQVCTDENMKSQNELQFTDLTKTLTDENEQLKDSLLRESDSDDQPTDNISMSKENNSETVKSKVLSIVDSNDHDVSKSTKGIEAPNNTENQIYSSVRHSGSGEKETNKLSNKNNDTSNLEKNGSNNSNITESITSDGKVDSNVIENETRKEISPNKIKSSLLNSSDESQSDNKKSLIEPKLRRKRIRESIKARKMLLTNSSSSDEDDVPSNGTLKNHKNIDKMIKEIVDEIETIKKITTSSSSGSSDEDLIKTLKKRRKHKLNRTKKRNKIDEDSTGSQSAVEENQNAGENSREESDSSSSQV